MHSCMHVCMYVCVYIYIYIYMCYSNFIFQQPWMEMNGTYGICSWWASPNPVIDHLQRSWRAWAVFYLPGAQGEEKKKQAGLKVSWEWKIAFNFNLQGSYFRYTGYWKQFRFSNVKDLCLFRQTAGMSALHINIWVL